MKKVLPLFLLVSFILWILPLGIFIKPSLQKLACDGQRAICMCHVNLKPSDKVTEPGMAIKASPSTSKENPSGGGNYFVSAKPLIVLNVRLASLFENQYHCYKNPFLAALEYVPKI